MEYIPDAEVLEPVELRDWMKLTLKVYSERVFSESSE
jgi:hypothetical protein